MKKILILFFITAKTLCGQITFYKQYGQGQMQSAIGASCVQQTFDGGYIMAGFIYPSSSDAQVYLVKTNSTGDTLWTKIIGGVQGFFLGSFVQQTADSGYVVTGMYRASEVYLIRTNTLGDTLWTKNYGDMIINCTGNSIQQTTDGGFIIAGTISSNSQDVYLIKTDMNGDTLWTKTFGGNNSETGNSVVQTSDGGYIVGGETWSNTAGSSDAYLVKTNSTGDTLWTKKYGGTGGENAFEVRQTADGGYVFCGNNGDIYVVKTNANGIQSWQKTFGGISHDDAFSIKQTTDKGYVIAGQIEHFSAAVGNYVADACLLKIDSNGTQKWNRNFGPMLGSPIASYGNYVSCTSDGGFIVTGYNQLDFLIKTDSMGNVALTGISSNDKTENNVSVLVYPNPAKQNINLSFSNPAKENYALTLFDFNGKLVRTISNIATEIVEIERQDLPAGFYFFRLQSDKRAVKGKFVIE